MYVRKTRSRNSICFQIGYKVSGAFRLLQHVGCAPVVDIAAVEVLRVKAKEELVRLKLAHQPSLFPLEAETPKAKLRGWKVVGFHRVFGCVYDEIGFPQNMLRDLVVTRIAYPRSKLATVRYLNQRLGIRTTKDKIYRFMDTLNKDQLSAIAFSFVSGKHSHISLVFYDVTTLRFSTDREDELRKKGFSKDHRSDQPQILVGLFVDSNGYPFDFDFFEGSTFEGHTFKTVVGNLVRKYDLGKITVVADAAMLSHANLSYLESCGINFIVGARLKNLPQAIKEKIADHSYTTTANYEMKVQGRRLIVNYSPKRAAKDRLSRNKKVQKLQQAIDSKKQVIRKSKYVMVEQRGKVTGIDYQLIAEDARFDGLKGYFTGRESQLTPHEVLAHYRNLWQVEKAFRMSKTDLRERPIYHRYAGRIKAHLILCFVSLLVMKEVEQRLKQHGYTLQQAIEILGQVGQGEVIVGRTQLAVTTELTEDAAKILKLF